jgi:hypothetical protein
MSKSFDIDAPLTECPVCGSPGESRPHNDRHIWECSSGGCYGANSPTPLTVAALIEANGGPALVAKLRAALRERP